LGDRTFMMACVMLFIVGFVLYATTLLLPQLAQTLMGYTAELAGLMIMPGGFALIMALPLVGFLLSRFDGRIMIAFGLLTLAAAMFLMARRFDLDVDFGTMMWARVFQSVSLAFLFIPINTAAYSYLPREKNNSASGIINLFRNIGASVGISFVTTMLARRAQFHQSILAAHANAYSSQFRSAIQGASQLFMSAGAVSAQQQSYGQLYVSILRQSNMIAYLDNFWMLGISALAVIPFVFLMKRPPKGASAAAH
jgi:DHA2 family multidrug resistance protein